METGDDALTPPTFRLAEKRQALIASPRQAGIVLSLLLDLLHPGGGQDRPQNVEYQAALLVRVEAAPDPMRSDQPGIGNVRTKQHSLGIGVVQRLSAVSNVDSMVPVEADGFLLRRAQRVVQGLDRLRRGCCCGRGAGRQPREALGGGNSRCRDALE